MTSHKTELPNLDFLRSIAVLLVAAVHTLLYTGHEPIILWSGITGVAIFFVHTSLVLMWSLERDPHVGRFYIRRIFRIYPLWLVVFFLTIAIRLPMSPAYYAQFRFYQPGPRSILEHVLLLFNLHSSGMVVGASWTLPLEVEMYLFLPVLFAFAFRFRTVWTLLLLDLFIIAYNRETLNANNSTLIAVIPYFIPGVMAYVLMKRASLQRLPAWSFIVWLFCIITVAHFYGNFRYTSFFCLALGLSIPLFKQIRWRALQRVSSEIAKYSYGIYLCHIGAIAFGVHILRNEPMVVRVAGYLAVFCGLPVLFYHLVEKPMIRVGARLASRVESGREPRVDDAALRLEPAP